MNQHNVLLLVSNIMEMDVIVENRKMYNIQFEVEIHDHVGI